jgi:hypothetical protein
MRTIRTIRTIRTKGDNKNNKNNRECGNVSKCGEDNRPAHVNRYNGNGGKVSALSADLGGMLSQRCLLYSIILHGNSPNPVWGVTYREER